MRKMTRSKVNWSNKMQQVGTDSQKGVGTSERDGLVVARTKIGASPPLPDWQTSYGRGAPAAKTPRYPAAFDYSQFSSSNPLLVSLNRTNRGHTRN